MGDEGGDSLIGNVSVELREIGGEEMVELRSLAGKLGWQLGFDSEHKVVFVNNRGNSLKLSLNNGELDGEKLQKSPEIVEGRSYLGINELRELIKRIGSREEPELLTGLYTDQREHLRGEKITAHLRAYNISGREVNLNFSSGQKYDLYLLKDDKEVWRWSEGKFFTMALVRKTLKPGGVLEYEVELPEGLEEGEYLLWGELVTVEEPLILNNLKIKVL